MTSMKRGDICRQDYPNGNSDIFRVMSEPLNGNVWLCPIEHAKDPMDCINPWRSYWVSRHISILNKIKGK